MSSVWVQGGYPTHLFLDRVNEHWICGICNSVIRSAVATKCGHVFCFSCVRVWIERYGACPYECGPAEMNHLNLVPALDQEVESQFVRCPRYKFGCHRILRVGDLILHEKVCGSSPSRPAAASSLQPKKGKMVEVKIKSAPGEPLGFHVVGGDSTFVCVSNVVSGLPASRAGLQAGDRIVKVNSRSVRGWPHSDVVRYVRACSPPVTLTVERVDSDSPTHYEVVDQHSPTPLRQPPVARLQNQPSDGDSGMGRSELSASSQLLSLRHTDMGGGGGGAGKTAATALGRPVSPHKGGAFDRNCDVRMSLRTESEMSRDSRRSCIRKPSLEPIHDRAEVQHLDITLQRSMGTRLGITLGFDQNKHDTSLYVMDLLDSGIAKRDGRLQVGDVVQKINGFEVQDTEEALMMFLEQDPVITITVARTCGQASSGTTGLSVRRVDSCGSLDSHTAHNTVPPAPMEHLPQPLVRVLSPQELRSPLKHFQPRSLHGNKLNGLSRGSPRRVAVKKTSPDQSPSVHRAKGPAIMHLRAQSAPETQV